MINIVLLLSSQYLFVIKGLLQCKIFIENSDKTLPENANKKISVFCDAYIPRNQGLNIKFLPVRKSIIVKNQLVYVTSRMCTATIHIRTSVQLAWNLYRFKPLDHITITLCAAEFETLYIYPLHLTTKTEIEINEIAKHIKYF